MNRNHLFLRLLLGGMLLVAAGGMTFSPEGCGRSPHTSSLDLDGKLNCPYMSGKGGTGYLQISVKAGDMERHERKPWNLAVVIDRSGSMSEEGKIDNVRSALERLIDELAPGDIFSLVLYDDVVEVPRPACVVGSKDQLRRLLSEIYPRGWTNLGGGLTEGFRQAGRNASGAYSNRVILLSDGLANRGITDPRELNAIAARYRARSISLTTMGVGLDYNENLMVGLAGSGGGNYYFIERSNDLASIFRKEFNTLSRVMAQNASVELTLAGGVRILDVIGCSTAQQERPRSIALGDLYANDTRELTVELEIPPGTGTRVVATGRLVYETESQRVHDDPSFTVSVHYVNDLAEVEKHRDMEVQGRADIAVSTRIVERGIQALDEGRKEEAAAQLQAARQMVQASPAAAASGTVGTMMKDQEVRLNSYIQTIEDKKGDVRKVKKSVQYENYKVQQQK